MTLRDPREQHPAAANLDIIGMGAQA